MSSIISIENLSKRYLVGHQSAQRERYTSLRDVLARSAKNFVRNGRDMMLGRQVVQGDEIEEFWALKDVSVEIERGDVVGIIGRNGAGKSTLLKVLSRITEPTTGRVALRGRVASLLEVGTGFHPELTGRENVFLNGAILGMTRAEIKRKFDEIVAFAEVDKFLDTPVKRYSSGMYVRLAFSVAAHLDPEILVVDEVLAVGDASFQKKCLSKMQDVSRNSGRTILFVSHQLGVLSQLCKNSIVLKRGAIDYFGITSRAVEHYLVDTANTGGYICTDSNKSTPHFKEISIGCEARNDSSDFAADESLQIKATIKNTNLHENLHIGIGIDDRIGSRITTFVQRIGDIVRSVNSGDETLRVSLCVEPGFIAPNNYSITAALLMPKGDVFDHVSGVCPFRIIDNGTRMSIFEGLDYGCILIPATWNAVGSTV